MMYPKIRVLLLIVFALFSFNSLAQLNNQPLNKFIMGAIMSGGTRTDDSVHSTFRSLGLNTIVEHAGNDNKDLLSFYNVIPFNQDAGEWIHFYATGLYSKWEAEENVDTPNVGMKHSFGGATMYNDTTCWYVSNLTGPKDSILYGPHYRQWKIYKRWDGSEHVNFIARYNMALVNSGQPENTEVCRITVKVRHARIINGHWDHTVWDDTLYPSVTLNVSDFDPDGHFKPIYFSSNPLEQTYNYDSYPTCFDESKMVPLMNIPEITWSDSDPDNGVEFCLEWLGSSQMTLYIDNVEVYDNHGWNDYVGDTTFVMDRIISYANEFPKSEWPNIKYWYAQDEPSSRDAFIPMHIVDEILEEANAAPLITHYYAGSLINGEDLLEKFCQIAQPKKLMIDIYPFSQDFPVVRWQDLDALRERFQKASTLDSTFYYTPQAFGYWDLIHSRWDVWRRPDTSEFKAPIMLSLAHGAKGLIFSDYDAYPVNNNTAIDSAIVGVPPDFAKQDLWYVIHDNLVPRLQGKLGDRLLGLKYTGDYISKRHFPGDGAISPSTWDYLTMPYNLSSDSMNWHAGFFYRNGYSDDKYFFLVNLLPENEDSVGIRIAPPVAGYYNYRFRNYEGYFDTTFYTGTYLTYVVHHPAGEGYLYEVAPVVKYGGKLYSNETISNNLSLYDDLTIENGKTLTVNAIYDCYANIYTKGSGKIQTVNGGTINFYNGKGIIAQGSPNIIGTSSHKLTIDFGSPTTGTGIKLLQGANAVINYCILKNSGNLITAESSQFNTSVNHCDFQNTSGYAISLAGTSTRNPGINYCTFTNTYYSIFAAGQNSFTINENTFTNNKLAISLSQISSVQIIHNEISSDLETLPGILLSSCGGNVRKNTITGHSYGISLANSSPLIGDNYIYGNRINGIYVGAGSVPDLRGALVGLPNNRYPISGYNDIENNGGYTSPPDSNDDGSEIYFGHSNIQLNNGCNMIADDRTVSPPLETTLYLMNGEVTIDRLYATYNAWGDTVYSARFGSLNVVYIPYNDEICDIPVSGGMLVMQDNDGNTLDTVYSAGPADYTPTPTEIQYAQALEYMINRDYSSADEIYSSIISSTPGDITSEDAYLGLYKSARLQNLDSLEMAALREMFNTYLENITDSVMMKVVSQLSLLTLVDEKQYNSAINGFGDIIIQNPQTEEALFAEIDAMTTSLLAGNGNDTTLNKGLNKTLLVKGTQDFQDRLNKLIQKRFGAEANTKDKDIIPTDYSLYNNYPNPFNPTTIIRFDIPERTQVELVVYDILGRRVKSLINNEFKNPGRYEVSFNASSLASGVYIYKLTTKNYSQARKMLLVK